MDIAQRLQELRKRAGYSQEQVAELLGLSRQAVSKWESGQGKPDVDNIVKLTEVYHTKSNRHRYHHSGHGSCNSTIYYCVRLAFAVRNLGRKKEWG
ncbi:hypothetical protein C804_01356 [Lachnospiraceae bacterium A4]|nr:hypothetical protein C804_01356 [Lachnospiraceae bacterium A4]